MPGSGESDNLDERIAAAFNNGVNSTDVDTLIKAAEAASVSANASAERARTRALDPALSATAATAARRAMEDAAFQRDRLQVAVTKLRERLIAVKADEEDARRLRVYEEVAAERDRLAAELRDFYPDVAERLAELLARIVANDREVEHLNAHALPRNRGRLLCAELVARGLEGFVKNSLQTPRITEELRLPTFEYSAHDRYAWPRRV
jgi:hypothetical protein